MPEGSEVFVNTIAMEQMTAKPPQESYLTAALCPRRCGVTEQPMASSVSEISLPPRIRGSNNHNITTPSSPAAPAAGYS